MGANEKAAATYHGRPQRFQRKRERGWRSPEGVIYVGRPTPFGNPYRQGDTIRLYRDGRPPEVIRNARDVRAARMAEATGRADFTVETLHELDDVVSAYELWLTHPDQADLLALARDGLAGRDLSCWCSLTHPCHVDVLLRLVNITPTESSTR